MGQFENQRISKTKATPSGTDLVAVCDSVPIFSIRRDLSMACYVVAYITTVGLNRYAVRSGVTVGLV